MDEEDEDSATELYGGARRDRKKMRRNGKYSEVFVEMSPNL